MAKAAVYKRVCGFGSSNTYLNRYLAVVGSTAVYDRESCYRKMTDTVNVSSTSWLPATWKPTGTIAIVSSGNTGGVVTPKNTVQMNNLTTQDNQTEDKTPKLLDQLFGGVSGSGGISFGKDQTKALIPIVLAVAGAIALMIWGGVFKIGKR